MKNRKGYEERKRRESRRKKDARHPAEEGVGEEGEQVDTRESEPPADDRQTAEEYKWRRNTSRIGREVEVRPRRRQEKGKRMTDLKKRDRKKLKTILPSSRT